MKRALLAVFVALTFVLSACGGTSKASDPAPEPARGASAVAVETTPAAAPSPEKAEKKPPVMRVTVRKAQKIPFHTRIIRTASLDRGVVTLQQRGRPGTRILVFAVKKQGGKVLDRTLVRTIVKRKAAPRIKLRGTHVDRPQCDSNYGGCVPIASDVDCGGGSGNGPAYVYGSVRVTGYDVYALDADGDGYGCD